MEEKLKWEKVDGTINRLKVPSGWLVETDIGGLAFIPDPLYTWDLNDYDFE